MKSFTNMVLSAMTGNKSGNTTPLLVILYLFSRLYAWVVGFWSALYDLRIFRQKKLPCRVISIGNLSVGGTGKTPMTIYVAQMLQDFGLKPVVISRGYKGAWEKKGGIVSDGATILSDAETAGDEPLMMARALTGIPVIVGRNRFDSGMRAVRELSADMIVLDDGFQHRRLYRDVDLVLIDDKTFLGNGYLLPRGILREPASSLARSHACILTRSLEIYSGHLEKLHQMFPEKKFFRSFHVLYIYGVFSAETLHFEKQSFAMGSEDFSFLKNASVFIFSGIANNFEFREMVKEKVKSVAGFREYPDHHPYTRQELEEIIRLSHQWGADVLITTEKDFSRIAGGMKWPLDLVVMGVKISFGKDEERFHQFIRQRIQ